MPLRDLARDGEKLHTMHQTPFLTTLPADDALLFLSHLRVSIPVGLHILVWLALWFYIQLYISDRLSA